jgi:hypothetical protein
LQSPTRRNLTDETRQNQNNPGSIKKTLVDLNFDVFYADEKGSTGAIIAGNASFTKRLPND